MASKARVLAPETFVRRVLRSPAPRILAVDVGTRKCGLVVADITPTGEARGRHELKTVTIGDKEDFSDLVDRVLKVAEQENICGLVIGWPLDERGQTTPACRFPALFAKSAVHSNFPVLLADEYASSVTARAILTANRRSPTRPMERTHSRLDATAARVILEGFLRVLPGYVEKGVEEKDVVREEVVFEGVESKGFQAPKYGKRRDLTRGERTRNRARALWRTGSLLYGSKHKNDGRYFEGVVRSKTPPTIKSQSKEERHKLWWKLDESQTLTEQALNQLLEKGLRPSDPGWKEALESLSPHKVIEAEPKKRSHGFRVDPEGNVERNS